MAKHRLGQSEGRQWGGPDLVTSTEPALPADQGATAPMPVVDDARAPEVIDPARE